MMSTLFAGTSGFAYPTWKPRFYPENLPQKKFLEHYAGRLNAVEINYTFRRLPNRATLESWVNATPPGFVFVLKANQRITHIRRLRNAGESLELFLRMIDPLRAVRRLGPVLFQLPPNLKYEAGLLEEFAAQLPGDIRFAFEFRHPSWLAEPVYEALRKRNLCLCLAESEKLEVPEVITSDFVYFRLRKPEYSAEDRAAIAARVSDLMGGGRDVYLFFKHEDTPEGALYAEEILHQAGAFPGLVQRTLTA